jgi:hypothetical protein
MICIYTYALITYTTHFIRPTTITYTPLHIHLTPNMPPFGSYHINLTPYMPRMGHIIVPSLKNICTQIFGVKGFTCDETE